MIKKLTNWLIKRDLQNRHIKINSQYDENQNNMIRVLNTLRENKVMVVTDDSGVYIRFAGNQNNDEFYSKEYIKIK